MFLLDVASPKISDIILDAWIPITSVIIGVALVVIIFMVFKKRKK